MKPSKNIIVDLLPLYYEGELSEDSRNLIESYFEDNPEFAKQMNDQFEQGLPTQFPKALNQEDKLVILNNTQKLLRLRSILFNIALLGTLFPFLYFTFFNFEGKSFDGVSWVWSDFGALALMLGLVAWIGYSVLRFRMRTSGV